MALTTLLENPEPLALRKELGTLRIFSALGDKGRALEVVLLLETPSL